MKKLILFLIIGLFIHHLKAQHFTFTDSATVSVLTCSPGQEAYSKFGHTALRINDPSTSTDLVFNYGIFSFGASNFYLKFINGETDYQLGVYETSLFLPEYAERNSMVWEQVINLRPYEKRKLISLLEENYLPENRTYRYNFVDDNCATRPKDMLTKSIRGYIQYGHQELQKSFRQWIGTYVGFDTWLKLGIDVIFGVDADRIVPLNKSMFLPEELMIHLQSAQINTPERENRKLVSEYKIIVNKDEDKVESLSGYFKPLYVSIFIFVIGFFITLWDMKRRHQAKYFDAALLVFTGIAGLIIGYMMLFSLHPLVKSNFNILWLNPLNLVLAFAIWFPRFRKYIYYYQVVNMTLLISTLIVFALAIQVFNLAAFPIIVLLLLRSTTWFARTHKRFFKHRD